MRIFGGGMKKKCLFDQYVDTILHGADYNPEQ